MHYKEIINYRGWKDNCFSRYIVKNNCQIKDLAEKINVPIATLSTWLRKDESEFSSTLKALVSILKKYGEL